MKRAKGSKTREGRKRKKRRRGARREKEGEECVSESPKSRRDGDRDTKRRWDEKRPVEGDLTRGNWCSCCC